MFKPPHNGFLNSSSHGSWVHTQCRQAKTSSGMSIPSEILILSLDSAFHFITIQNPDAARDPETRRQIRSHAVKQALQGKRKVQRESRDNFRATSLSKISPRRLEQRGTQTSPFIPGSPPLSQWASSLYPLDGFAADSSRLKALLTHRKFSQGVRNYFLQAHTKSHRCSQAGCGASVQCC
jgi:hypothetical protein